MSKNYVVYHLHSDLSNGITNIDSITKYNEYIDYAKSLGMKAIGFSEHGSVLEWVDKKRAVEKAGIKYIHAQEFYITEELFVEPDTTELYESLLGTDEENAQNEIIQYIEDNKRKIRDNYHCVLIAKNHKGVKELNRLSSKAFNKEDGHFYYQPRITFDELVKTSDNIIITTACLGGILHNGNETIKEKFLEFCISNKHRCYLEIQHHNDNDQKKYNQYLYSLSQKYSIPLIAGTDTHGLNDRHMLGRSILQKSKEVSFVNEDSWDMTFKTYEQLVEAYELQDCLSSEIYIEAIENTNKMTGQIEEFELDYSTKYPILYEDSESVFKQKIAEGIIRRGVNKYPNYNEYKNRIKYEIEVYRHNEAVDFMLLEEDYKTALRNQGVSFGYSRGSVSGSVIAYLLGITEVDSVKYGLNFERFMNKERVSLADIDTDWYSEDRWRVRDCLFNKKEVHCCNIITFNTIKMRGAIKDVGRALGMSPEETQGLSNLVQEDENGNEYVEDKYVQKHKELFDYVDIVVGTITSLGRHAAGLVVSPNDIADEFGTLYISSDDKPVSQINMDEIDSLNYVKLDILGLDCVGLINKTCELANIPMLTPDNMDFSDMNVWNDIANDTTLIFQFESDFAGKYLQDILRESTIKKIKENNKNLSYIDLMSMANGAIRPAGESYREELAKGEFRDNGHEVLNEFLAPTLGFLVYQEQIIEFLHKFCGFTMGEADVIRRGFAKKTGTDQYIPLIKYGGRMISSGGEQSKHYIKGFINTMVDDYDVTKDEAEKLIENFIQVILDASSYLFSLNHADPYSFLGFACGYLRHYYPLETFTSALNIYSSKPEKMSNIKAYIDKKGYKIESIKFGKSKSEYFHDKNTNSIYQGIASIKYCNSQMADELYELSKNKYNSFIDLLVDINERTSVNSRQLKILTGLNFFDEFGKNQYLLDTIEVYDNIYNRKQINKSDLEKFGLTEYLMKKYSNKITPKQYRELDTVGLVKELCSRIPNKSMPLIEYMKFENEYLGNITYTNPKVDDDYYVVIEFTTYKNPTTPYLLLRSIKTGDEKRARITKGSMFKHSPFGEYSVLKIYSFDEKFKRKKVGEEWIITDETQKILSDYEVIKD